MKKIIYVFQVSLVFLVALLCLTQCKSRKERFNNIDPAFTGYISAFTSGNISNESNIMVRLTEEIPGKVKDLEETEKLFSFSPSIKGRTFWEDSRTVIFSPDKPLPSDKFFEVRFQLSKLIQVPDNLKTLKFQFKTLKQSIKVESKGLKTYNNKDLSKQKLEGSLITADYADNSSIETLLTAVQNGKMLEIKWEHYPENRNHQFTVENITRTEKKGQVIIEWDGKAIGSTDKGNQKINIPPLGDFEVFDVNIVQQPQQCITIYFSDPLDPDQDLNGLIYFNDNTAVRLVIKDSEVKIYPEHRLTESTTIIVDNGVKNILGYPLKTKFKQEVKFSSIKPEVQFIGNGVILPSTNGLILPFKAVNLSAVNVTIIKIFENNINQFLQNNQVDGQRELKRVGRIIFKDAIRLTSDKPVDLGEWNTFSLELSDLIKTEPGAIYRVKLSFERNHSLYPCSEDDEGDNEDDLPSIDEDPEISAFDQPQDYYYYDDYDDYYYDDYDWEDRDNPCKKSYYLHGNHSVSQNVLASDLGLIVKGGDNNELKIAVTNIVTTDPLSNVAIEVYNLQNQLIGEGTTDSKGMASIIPKGKGFLIIAKKDQQRGYLRIDDGSALSLSMFDVSGQNLKKGIKGYIYGERGVWRPGDSIFVQFILEDKNHSLPAGHPVIFELYTPQNQLYQRKVKTSSVNGFYDFRTATKADDETGNWLAKFKVGGSVFTQYLKIETIKPNRLKIKLDFNTEILQKDKNYLATIESKWLHGAIAKNLKADMEVSVSKGNTQFKGFNDYLFDDPTKDFSSQDNIIFDGNLDEKGKATTNIKFTVGESAPGMLNAKFKTRVYEQGGDFSSDIYSVKYSPFSSYVGIKVPDEPGWNGALYSNEPNLIPIVTVDNNGKPVDRQKVKIEVYELYWSWWWEHSDDDLGRYVNNESQSRMLVDYIDTHNGKAMYEMNMNTESWGRKLIRVTDPESGHSTGKVFYTTYKGWWSNSSADNPGGAEMLSFSTDKKTYNVGEQVNVQLPEMADGKALVSLETGSKVLETFWIETSKKNNSFTFKANEAMSPNVFIHISYIQPHKNKNNDLPIRLYGVQPISVENPETHLNPVIIMPDVLEPEKEVTIKVKEANGKKMTYTIAIVDDGLLDLTRFKTPDAWTSFYAPEALGVKTWDLYKYIMGAYSGEMAGLLAVGGDEDLGSSAGKKANRFKPVVKFLGPFVLKSGTNTHTFMMPNYIGSVRTMIVAGQDGAYGSAEKTTPVKKPLMVVATLPRVLGPTEQVKLPVTIFAMDSKIKKVDIKVETNKLLSMVGAASKSVSFTEEGDQTINFDLNVTENIGIGKVKIIASSGKEKSEYEIELDVRLPNPRVTRTYDGMIEPGKTIVQNYDAFGVKGTNHAVMEISGIPPLNLENRLEYLIQYPHGCIEQTTSSVFPQLHLSSLIQLDNKQKDDIEENIKQGIDRLKKFQLDNGGMSYWPGESGYASEWGTNYAGHFLLEAKALGYTIPGNMLKNWIKFQTEMANNWSVNSSGSQTHYYNSSQLTQAYRLYTLALANEPALGAMNRMREMTNLTTAARWRLAAAFLLAGRENVAEKLVEGVSTKVDDYCELSYSYGSNVRDEAMILETLVLLNNKLEAKKVLDEISKNLSSEKWYSTQTTSYCLLAVAKFVGTEKAGNSCSFEVTVNNQKPEKLKTNEPISQYIINADAQPQGKVQVKNIGDKTLFTKLQLSGIPLIGDDADHSSDLVIAVNYTNMDGNTIDILQLEQGTDFIAEVTVTHPGIRDDYKEMALTQIFPSGWEIRNLRLEENTSINVGNAPTYQDIRDDRVYTYFNISRNSVKTYRILLNAAYAGKFYLPTVYCEAMYNKEISAQKGGKWVEVIKGE